MTDVEMSDKETHCLFINNGNDLLNLKKVVSKKPKVTNGHELNENHDVTDSIHLNIDNTSSLEPNLEMDGDTDRNITINSLCTQDDSEPENIDISNDDVIETDVINSEKDNQAISINRSEIPCSSKNFLDKELDKQENILALEGVMGNERKRKFEDSIVREQESSKIRKLWNNVKYPFQKIFIDTSLRGIELNKSNVGLFIHKDLSVSQTTVPEKNQENLETEKIQTTSNNPELAVENNVEGFKYTERFCNIL